MLKRIPQPDPLFFKTILGVRCPSILLFQASKHPGVLKSDPPHTHPRLASLYTYTQPRPSAGFRNMCICKYIYIYVYIYICIYIYVCTQLGACMSAKMLIQPRNKLLPTWGYLEIKSPQPTCFTSLSLSECHKLDYSWVSLIFIC